MELELPAGLMGTASLGHKSAVNVHTWSFYMGVVGCLDVGYRLWAAQQVVDSSDMALRQLWQPIQ